MTVQDTDIFLNVSTDPVGKVSERLILFVQLVYLIEKCIL